MNLTTTLSTFIVRVTTILVSPIGFEPMTYALEVRCSIQLSYGDKLKWKPSFYAHRSGRFDWT